MDETSTEPGCGAISVETAIPESTFSEFDRVAAAWNRNRHRIPPTDLEPYRDHYVAWNSEVTDIIAAAAGLDELYLAIQKAGYEVAQCPIEFVE